METSVNSRVLLLKTHLGLNNNEFALKANISTTTFWNIQNGGEIAPKTIRNIQTALNVNKEWLLTGKGKMFNEPQGPAPGGEPNAFTQALDLLKHQLQKLEDQITKKDEQIASLSRILEKANFNGLLVQTDSAKVINLETGPTEAEPLRAMA